MTNFYVLKIINKEIAWG